VKSVAVYKEEKSKTTKKNPKTLDSKIKVPGIDEYRCKSQ
jgi:hypothetical protein